MWDFIELYKLSNYTATNPTATLIIDDLKPEEQYYAVLNFSATVSLAV